MWRGSARSARLPVQNPATSSTSMNAEVRARVSARTGRDRAAAVARSGACPACVAMTRILAGYNRAMHADRTVQLRGRRFHYTEWGPPAAAVVVFLHGVTGHARTWDEEARVLAERYRALALDQRGHGDSDPAPDGDYSDDALLGDLVAFVDTLELHRVAIVALRLGGRGANNFAGPP